MEKRRLISKGRVQALAGGLVALLQATRTRTADLGGDIGYFILVEKDFDPVERLVAQLAQLLSQLDHYAW